MTIIVLTGDLGSGKTALMTFFTKCYFDGGAKVYANYHLKFPYKPMRMENFEDFDFDYKNAVIALDELHTFADSRGSATSQRNKIFSYWVLQSRKMHLILLITTQVFGQIDVRIRNSVDYYIECKNLSGTNARKNVVIEFTITSKKGHSIKKKMRIDKIFPLYDTDEVIHIIPERERAKVIKKPKPKRKKKKRIP